jgi:YD repeat-containing protein
VDAFSANDPLPPGPLPYADITNPQSLNKYTYTFNNPLKYVDPDGHYVESAWDAASLMMGIHSYISNVKQGNVGSAVLDAIGITADLGALILPVVSGGAGAALKGLRAGNSVWDLAPVARGDRIAKALGQNLPDFFPVIDKFKDGVASSIKSLDLDAKSYQDVGKLTSKLEGYVDKLADFKGATSGRREVKAEQIKSKVLELAIEKGKGSKEQLAAIEAAKKYAKKKGVELRVVEVQ